MQTSQPSSLKHTHHRERSQSHPRTAIPFLPDAHDRRLLGYALSSVLLVNVGIWLVYHLLGLGSPANMKGDVLAFLHVRQWTDSWLPMLKSLDYFRDHPREPLYYAKLYDTLIYPLPSLFPLMLIRKFGLGAQELRVLAWLSWLAVIGVLAAALSIGRQQLRRRGGTVSLTSALGVVVLWAGFYPLFKGYALGNASTFLTLVFAALILVWSRTTKSEHERSNPAASSPVPSNPVPDTKPQAQSNQRLHSQAQPPTTFPWNQRLHFRTYERMGGLLVACMAMVKPQFVLLVLWFALRKKWNALAGALLLAGILFGISFAVFGARNNLDYLGILASLSHKAQSHFGNQSMFGTLNRMVFNGENLPYHPFVYSPYIPWIYRTTVATSLLLTALGLFFPWGKLRGSAADLGAMGILSVAASPMAWEHHYGIAFPVLAWTWFTYACWQTRPPWLLALSAFLLSNALSPIHQFLWNKPGLNLLQSYLYLGALLLVFLLMRLARTETNGPPTRL